MAWSVWSVPNLETLMGSARYGVGYCSEDEEARRRIQHLRKAEGDTMQVLITIDDLNFTGNARETREKEDFTTRLQRE